MKKNILWIIFWVMVASAFVGFTGTAIYCAKNGVPFEMPDPRIEVINGCQYIKTPNGNDGYSLTHAGNCTNEVHLPK